MKCRACITLLNNHSGDTITPCMFLIHGCPSSGGGGGGGSCCRAAPVAPAAEPRHMLSNEEPDNFEGLAVAAEVIALGKKPQHIASLHYTASILNSHVIGDSNSLCISPTALRSVNKPHPNIRRHGRPVQSAQVT